MSITIAFDTETHLIKPGVLAPPLVCLSCHNEQGTDLLNRTDAIHWMRDGLSAKDLVLVGHNVAYDMAVMAAAEPELLPLIFQAYENGRIKDTLIREKLSFNAQGRLSYDHVNKKKNPSFALSQLVYNHFKRGLPKGEDTWRLRYEELDGVPLDRWPTDAVAYAKNDAMWTYRVYTHQNEPLHIETNNGRRAVQGYDGVINEDEQTRAAFALHLASCWGYRTDSKQVAQLIKNLQASVVSLDKALFDAGLMKWKRKGGEDVLSRNMVNFKARVEDAYAPNTPPLTDKGATKTDADTLQASGDPLLVQYADEGNAARVLSKWQRFLEDGTKGAVNHGFNVLVETGRTSSYKPPTQQLDRKGGLRPCFVPRPGYVYLAADYSQVEMCALAQVCIDWGFDSRLAQLIRASTDLHTWMGSFLPGGSDYNVMVQRVKDNDKDAIELRRIAKVLNFGFPGGMGNPETFVQYARGFGVEVDPKDVRGYKRTWMSALPEMQLYFDRVSSMFPYGVDHATVEQLRSGRVRGGTTYTSACNTMFQGLAADGAKAAMFQISRECYTGDSPLRGSRLVFFVHDEFVLEVPEERLGNAAKRLEQLMLNGMEQYIPDVPIKVDSVAMRRWLKGAVATYKNGALVPYEE